MRALARKKKKKVAVIYRTSVIYVSIVRASILPGSCRPLFFLSHKAFTALFIIMLFPSNYLPTCV